jgi:hypothetical protein
MLKATWQADNAVLELDQYTGIAAAKEGSPLRSFIPASSRAFDGRSSHRVGLS